MTNDQTNQFNMQERVEQFFTTKHETIKDIPPIVSAHSELQSNTVEIRSLIQLIESTKSLTSAKNNLEERIINGILKLAGAFAAHAVATSDEKLALLGAVSPTTIKGLRNTQLIDSAQKYGDTATPIVTALVPWGITQSDVDSLFTDKQAFQKSIGEIGNQQGSNSATNDQIRSKLSDNQELLKNKVDKLMLPFKTNNPSFYSEYQSARQILDLGGSHSGSKDTPTTPQA
jgi:hypothetical protein